MAPPPSVRWVAGVDGCRSGWVVVLHDGHHGTQSARVVRDFVSVLALRERPGLIAVDVPIGLLDAACRGGRACEVMARQILGARASSVFSAPTRKALLAFRAGSDYQAVSLANRGGAANAPGISRQTFGILPKIDEVDVALTPPAQNVVHEVHPELCFAEANAGKPLVHSKKTAAGRNERVAILTTLGFSSPLQLLGPKLPKGVKSDALLDASIACWTAGRLLAGRAVVTPSGVSVRESTPCAARQILPGSSNLGAAHQCGQRGEC